MSGTNQEAILGQILTGISDLRREVYRLSDRLDNVERTEPNTPTAANFSPIFSPARRQSFSVYQSSLDHWTPCLLYTSPSP